jgi:hypothetical protein
MHYLSTYCGEGAVASQIHGMCECCCQAQHVYGISASVVVKRNALTVSVLVLLSSAWCLRYLC